MSIRFIPDTEVKMNTGLKKVTSVISIALVMIMALSAIPFNAKLAVMPAITASAQEDEPLLTLEVLSDTHIGSDNALDLFKDGVNKINSQETHADGVIVAGDITNSGWESEYRDFYETLLKIEDSKLITANGNHDYGQTKPREEHRPVAIKYRNQSLGVESEKDYYSTEVKGYKVVVLGDEGSAPNSASISDEQIAFLDSELAQGAKDGKPCFVICHWPLKGTHGEALLWPIIPGGSVKAATTRKLKQVMGKYDNVFYISGHLHAGLNGPIARLFNMSCVQVKNGINCINVPSFGKGNRFGVTAKGTGMRFTLTEDKLLIEGRNYLTGEWYGKYTYELGVKSFTPPAADNPQPGDSPVAPLPDDNTDLTEPADTKPEIIPDGIDPAA